MRRRIRVLAASAIAVLLVGAAGFMVLDRGGPASPPHPQTTALSPGTAELAESNPAPQPPRPVPPSFDIVKVGPTGMAVIAGRAEPGSKVTVRDGDQVIGQVTADGRGEWVLVPDQAMAPGDRLLALEAVSGKDGAAVKSDETVALSITPTAPGAQGTTALAVVLPRNGAARVLQRPDVSSPTAAASGSPAVLAMDTLEYDEQGRMLLSGRARPGAKVEIYIGNEPVTTATADATGAWSAIATRQLDPRRAELRLDQLAEPG